MRGLGGLLVVCVLVGCARADAPDLTGQRVLLGTTTSTAASGFLDALLPVFEKETGIHVEFIAVGSGAALKHGENGDVDIILAHSPEAEEAFVRAGYGLSRVPIMSSDFVLVGPESDPAAVASAPSVLEAFRRIARTTAPFLSRGDSSGTHVKERTIWRLAGIEPAGGWYMVSGQGMGFCLLLADEKSGYTLSDRATFVAWRDKIHLAVLHERDPLLANPYSLIVVAPRRRPGGNLQGAEQLLAWFTSPHGRERIAGFRVNGHALFTPVAPPEAMP